MVTAAQDPVDTESYAFPPFIREASLCSLRGGGHGEGGRENMLWVLAAALEEADLAQSLTLEDAMLMRIKKPLIYLIVSTHEVSLYETLVVLVPTEKTSSASLCKLYPPRFGGLKSSRVPIHFLSQANGMIGGPLRRLADRPHIMMAWSLPWALESDFWIQLLSLSPTRGITSVSHANKMELAGPFFRGGHEGWTSSWTPSPEHNAGTGRAPLLFISAPSSWT